MAEPDHIFVNPLPNLATENEPAGYPFFYIKPAENEKIMRKFYPKENGPVTDVDPIGNSPVIIHKVKFQFIIACIRLILGLNMFLVLSDIQIFAFCPCNFLLILANMPLLLLIFVVLF